MGTNQFVDLSCQIMNKLGICLSFLFQFTLIFAFKTYSSSRLYKPSYKPYSSSRNPACPFGPCEVPKCCDNGIAIKRGQNPFEQNKCYHRGCYSCLSQQYLLGIHERCSFDQSIMKSLCAPGMSCMIYCSEKLHGKESCWHKYGTCQHNHVPRLAESKYPGNVTVIPGLKKSDAKRHAVCTREHSMCRCRNNKCDSKNSKEQSWCFVSYIKNPAHPTQNCYSDIKWSATYGSFYSHEACLKLSGKGYKPNRPRPRTETRSLLDDHDEVPVMNNFDNIAKSEVEADEIPEPPSEPEVDNTPVDDPEKPDPIIEEDIPEPDSEPEEVDNTPVDDPEKPDAVIEENDEVHEEHDALDELLK